MLWIVNSAPEPLTAQLLLLRRLVEPGDALLLIEEAVFAARLSAALRAWRVQTNCLIYALALDLEARGVGCPPEITAINGSTWAELVIRHDKVICW